MNIDNQHYFSSTTRPVLKSSGNRLTCARCYDSLRRSLAAVKSAIEHRFSLALAGYEQLLKGALNEAEALAWQTPFPHLFFPALAEEKASEAQKWAAHQQAVQAQTSFMTVNR